MKRKQSLFYYVLNQSTHPVLNPSFFSQRRGCAVEGLSYLKLRTQQKKLQAFSKTTSKNLVFTSVRHLNTSFSSGLYHLVWSKKIPTELQSTENTDKWFSHIHKRQKHGLHVSTVLIYASFPFALYDLARSQKVPTQRQSCLPYSNISRTKEANWNCRGEASIVGNISSRSICWNWKWRTPRKCQRPLQVLLNATSEVSVLFLIWKHIYIYRS